MDTVQILNNAMNQIISIIIVIQEALLILCIPESDTKKEMLQECATKIKTNIENVK